VFITLSLLFVYSQLHSAFQSGEMYSIKISPNWIVFKLSLKREHCSQSHNPHHSLRGACDGWVKVLDTAVTDSHCRHAQLLIARLPGCHQEPRHDSAAQEGPWGRLGQDPAGPCRRKPAAPVRYPQHPGRSQRLWSVRCCRRYCTALSVGGCEGSGGTAGLFPCHQRW